MRIGDVEGTVTHLGVLSTKLRTFRRKRRPIPNAVVVGQTTTDYSRFDDTGGVFTPTSVTIGYDAPWRQVHALLCSLPSERRVSAPTETVSASGRRCEDFYVKYTLFVCLEQPAVTGTSPCNTLHAHIQDLFNEYGVQIMSPNYRGDPAAPKIVARKNWYSGTGRRR